MSKNCKYIVVSEELEIVSFGENLNNIQCDIESMIEHGEIDDSDLDTYIDSLMVYELVDGSNVSVEKTVNIEIYIPRR